MRPFRPRFRRFDLPTGTLALCVALVAGQSHAVDSLAPASEPTSVAAFADPPGMPPPPAALDEPPAPVAEIPPAAASPAPASAPVEAPPSGPRIVALPGIDGEVARALAARFATVTEGQTRAARDRLALSEFYTAREFRPAFVRDGRLDERALAAMDRISAAAQDGLDPADYRLPDRALSRAGANAEALVEAEVTLWSAVLAFARHAQAGQTEPRRLSAMLTARPPLPETAAVIGEVAVATDVAAILGSYNPPHAGFRELREKLAGLRAQNRSREAAVVVANMERWRWLPRDLGASHILVNVPAFKGTVVRDGAAVHSFRVVVGKQETQTPIFSDEMDHVVVNPSWTVPQGILRRSFGGGVPRGFQVVRSGSWWTIRQPPGPNNALGRIKFMFPNDHAVYLHDTPAKHYFAHTRRAYSNGCVRVEGPLQLGEIALELGRPGEDWSVQRIERMFGPSERFVRFTRPVPVHLVYFTASVEDGRLVMREDIYGHDARVTAALGAPQPRVAEAAPTAAPRAARAAASNRSSERSARATDRPAPRTVPAASSAAQNPGLSRVAATAPPRGATPPQGTRARETRRNDRVQPTPAPPQPFFWFR